MHQIRRAVAWTLGIRISVGGNNDTDPFSVAWTLGFRISERPLLAELPVVVCGSAGAPDRATKVRSLHLFRLCYQWLSMAPPAPPIEPQKSAEHTEHSSLHRASGADSMCCERGAARLATAPDLSVANGGGSQHLQA